MARMHWVGLWLAVGSVLGLIAWSAARPAGRRGPTPLTTAGMLMGTLVGGSATIGTAQLAFQYGLSAWWFTLGSGIACLVLAFGYAVPLRRSGAQTLVGIVKNAYGPAVGTWASVLSAIGNFINILSQLLSATAVVAVAAPGMEEKTALGLCAGFMLLYGMGGGMRGAGLAGLWKLGLLYLSMLCAGILVFRHSGGVEPFLRDVSALGSRTGIAYGSLLARGAATDLGAGLSMVFGVLTTQTYAQAIVRERTDRSAKTAAVIGGLLIPPIGAGGILVGLYMRLTMPAIPARTALTTFALTHMPPLLGGLMLGALFIAVIGTGAGLALGISTILNADIFRCTHITPRRRCLAMAAVLFTGALLCAGSLGDTILSFAFLSMGLRGAVLFAPLWGALRLPGKIPPAFAMAAVLLGPAGTLAARLWLPGLDPAIPGIALAWLTILLGFLANKIHRHRLQPEDT